MRYKVPQDVQREDQILWFITLRQLIILIIGFGISYTMFNSLNKIFVLDEISQILIWFPAGLAAAFAFLKVKGLPLFQFILLLIEQTFFRPPRRRWSQNGGSPFVSLTVPFSLKMKKKVVEKTAGKEVSTEKIKNLAAVLDGQSVDSKVSLKHS